jgi:hypothetical protein
MSIAFCRRLQDVATLERVGAPAVGLSSPERPAASADLIRAAQPTTSIAPTIRPLLGGALRLLRRASRHKGDDRGFWGAGTAAAPTDRQVQISVQAVNRQGDPKGAPPKKRRGPTRCVRSSPTRLTRRWSMSWPKRGPRSALRLGGARVLIVGLAYKKNVDATPARAPLQAAGRRGEARGRYAQRLRPGGHARRQRDQGLSRGGTIPIDANDPASALP